MSQMTKQRLTQYIKLRQEISELEDRIHSAVCTGEIVVDFAKDYSTGYPKVIPLEGFGSPAVPRLSARKAKCLAECEAIERFIDGIEDSIPHQLFDLRFIEGKTMEETAKQVGYSAKQAARIIDGFLEKMSTDVR